MCERYMAPRMEQYPAGGAEKFGGLSGTHYPQPGAEPAAKTEPLETGRRRNDADLGGAGRDAARPGHPGAALGAQGHSGSAGALFAGADPGGTDTVPPAVLVGGAGKNGGRTQRHFPAAGQEHTGAAEPVEQVALDPQGQQEAANLFEALRDLRNELEKEEITL